MNGVISVIVPIYNVERYLPQCLDSILTQDYSKLEVILINDGSVDASGSICDEYARRDCRIKVIHQKNSGAAAAKNAGLHIATGEYLSFVDSDDYLEPGVYSHMLQLMHQNHAEVAQCAFRYVYCNRQENFILHQGRSVMDNKVFLDLFRRDWSCALLWNKLYKRSLFDGVFFEEGRKIDDEYFTYHAFLNRCQVVVDDRVIYNYRQRSSSVMQKPEVAEQRILDWMDAFTKRRIDVAERYPELKRRFDESYLWVLCNSKVRFGSTPKTIQNQKKEIRNYFSNGGTILLAPALCVEVLKFYLSDTKTLLGKMNIPPKTDDIYFP